MTENIFQTNKIRTCSGKYIDPFDPDPEMIDIEDIVWSLSRIQRFLGHTTLPYSVAQHCLMVSDLVPEEHKLAALLHDSSEAYLCDIPTPIKYRMTEYCEREANLLEVISQKYGFQFPFSDEIKKADTEALVHEWHAYMIGDKPKSNYYWMSSSDVRREFHRRFLEYSYKNK